MELIDTHCHVHFPDYGLDPDSVVKAAKVDGVTCMVLVGCTLEDSEGGVEFVRDREGCYASIGLHPHEAKTYVNSPDKLQKFRNLLGDDNAREKKKIVAIGECGLDYYYNHSPKEDQIKMLEFQLDLALKHRLPVIFHVRDAFDDFWPIVDNFKGIKGVVHSFTATTEIMEQAVSRGFYIGLNGIMTFTSDETQLAMAKNAPLKHIVVETDAPFLTPRPFRGTICEPRHVRVTAEFLAHLRGESAEQFATATTVNARQLFNF